MIPRSRHPVPQAARDQESNLRLVSFAASFALAMRLVPDALAQGGRGGNAGGGG